MWNVSDAIRHAETLLPGVPGPDEGEDIRWQAVIGVAEFIETDPEPLWTFAAKWGSYPDEDLRAAVATCILEHLLEYHFDLIFPRVTEVAKRDPLFADTVLRCWAFGQSELPRNRLQFEALKAELPGIADRG